MPGPRALTASEKFLRGFDAVVIDGITHLIWKRKNLTFDVRIDGKPKQYNARNFSYSTLSGKPIKRGSALKSLCGYEKCVHHAHLGYFNRTYCGNCGYEV
jgi:hypothetical protein